VDLLPLLYLCRAGGCSQLNQINDKIRFLFPLLNHPPLEEVIIGKELYAHNISIYAFFTAYRTLVACHSRNEKFKLKIFALK
jgi:hypothetical protein